MHLYIDMYTHINVCVWTFSNLCWHRRKTFVDKSLWWRYISLLSRLGMSFIWLSSCDLAFVQFLYPIRQSPLWPHSSPTPDKLFSFVEDLLGEHPWAVPKVALHKLTESTKERSKVHLLCHLVIIYWSLYWIAIRSIHWREELDDDDTPLVICTLPDIAVCVSFSTAVFMSS